ncbi:MAG: YkgJ family cysteine cluster protein [Nitrosomonadales bacterium]|nr:YkgJ family cysteine cluster protein [Nitrosomonadales bacterium]
MEHIQVASPTGDGRVYYDMTGVDNPCSGCGACCRHFRVSFYHGELDTQPGGHVPADLTVSFTPFRVCMKGTEAGNGRCISLLDDLRCGIYALRPSVCREFPALMPDGSLNPDCVRLRAKFGIAVRTCPPDAPEAAMR